jgi:hypothetical protein
MLLSKIKISRPLQLFKAYSAWLVLCALVLILTNAFASLDKIKGYGFHPADVVLTFGFLVFGGILEAAAAAVLLVLVEILLEKVSRRRLDLLFRLIVAAGLVVCWVVLLLTIFRVI